MSNLINYNIQISFLRLFEKLYDSVYKMEAKGIAKLTGCKKPCYYNKYSFNGDKHMTALHSDDYVLALWAVSNDTIVETEFLLYPLTSLVAEFGGTLGLFLGFSFMTLWDGLKFSRVVFQTLWSKTCVQNNEAVSF